MTALTGGSTSHGWFDVQTIGYRVTAIAEPGHAEHVHSYLVEGESLVAVLDTGMGVGDFHTLFCNLSDREPVVLQSHAHWDHVGDSAEFDRIMIHPAETEDLELTHTSAELASWFGPEQLRGIPFPTGFDPNTIEIPGASATGYLNHGDRIELGGRELEIYHTPGHSPGGITIFDSQSRLLFPGDALNLGPVYLFGDQADLAEFQRSLDLLVELAGRASAIYPSHYEIPMTPDDVILTQRAFDTVVAGRKPDELHENMEIYRFERFSFLIAPGALEQIR